MKIVKKDKKPLLFSLYLSGNGIFVCTTFKT
jgi:hypothetical protein